MGVSEWPKFDPITNRMVCQNCFNGIHYHEMMTRKNFKGETERYYVRRDNLNGKFVEHACDGECDCVHRSEENWAAIEKQKSSQNRRERRKLEKDLLAESPLAAVNPKFQVKL